MSEKPEVGTPVRRTTRASSPVASVRRDATPMRRVTRGGSTISPAVSATRSGGRTRKGPAISTRLEEETTVLAKESILATSPERRKTSERVKATNEATSSAGAAEDQKITKTPQRAHTTTSRLGISPVKSALSKGAFQMAPATKKLLQRAYSIIRTRRDFAYSTPDSPIYGENTELSLSRAFQAMGLGDSPRNIFCDVGSGTGTPCIQAACEFPSLTCYGFELIAPRWWISQNILLTLLQDDQLAPVASRVLLAHLNLQALTDFGPCTHVFSFDTGFPSEALRAYGAALKRSKHVRVLACFQKLKVLEETGFPELELVDQIPMKLISSGESHSIFVYHVVREETAVTAASFELNAESTSWNLTGLFAPPNDRNYARSEGHHSSYSQGEECRRAGVARYREWLTRQIGLHRSTRVQTRASTRRMAASSAAS